jgi:homoserine dehydrogenase
MGLGVVGSAVAKVLTERKEAVATQVGCPVALKKILVRDPRKQRSLALNPSLLTTDPLSIISDPEIDIVIEVIGGENPALEFIKSALSQGKHVVTANKEVIAKHGPELVALARQNRVDIRYEASVGGGIPLVAPFKRDLLANDISAIHAIINGTTNYILTRMAYEGLDFAAALAEAKRLGYAEPDPVNDIEGIDAAYKLAILATLAFHSVVRPEDVYREGISRLAASDFRYAKELGYAIKLLAIAKEKDGAIEARVHPVFLPQDLLLAKVDGVFNAVQVEGNLLGRVIFYGQGAGALPTSSAVIADVIAVAQRVKLGVNADPAIVPEANKRMKPISEIETRYYIRMSTLDRPGVLAQISRILGDLQISLSSVIQRETDKASDTAQIVLMTHPARERAMQEALEEIGRLQVVKEISNFVRVED